MKPFAPVMGRILNHRDCERSVGLFRKYPMGRGLGASSCVSFSPVSCYTSMLTLDFFLVAVYTLYAARLRIDFVAAVVPAGICSQVYLCTFPLTTPFGVATVGDQFSVNCKVSPHSFLVFVRSQWVGARWDAVHVSVVISDVWCEATERDRVQRQYR